MVKITVFREDNQPVLHLQRRQSASASHFEKTILPVLKKTILLEKTILPFPQNLPKDIIEVFLTFKQNSVHSMNKSREKDKISSH